MPERSYEKYSVSKAFKYPSKIDNYINDPTMLNDKLLTEQFKSYLSNHNKNYNLFVERPSMFVKKEKFLPQLLNYKAPFTIKKSNYETFNQPKHNTFIYENKFRIKN